MQEWEMEAATRIFLCSERSLSKRVKTVASVFHPILEIRGHFTTSQH